MSVRLTYIGGTVAAAVMGDSQWTNAHAELYNALLRYAGLAEPLDLSKNKDVQRGLALEDVIINMVKREHDPTIKPFNDLVYHPRIPRMGGHADAIGRHFIYEMKAPRKPSSKVKPEYFWQMVHYTSVLNAAGVIDHYSAKLCQLDYENWRVIITEYEDLSEFVSVLEERMEEFCRFFDNGIQLIEAGRLKTRDEIFDYVQNYEQLDAVHIDDPEMDELITRMADLRTVRRAIDNEIRTISGLIKAGDYGSRATRKTFGRIHVI